MGWDNPIDSQLKEIMEDIIEGLDYENKGEKDKAREKLEKIRERLGIAPSAT